MKKTAIVVDSTSVIGNELLEKHDNLFLIPLHILIGTVSYKDGIDLKPDEFFEKISKIDKIPTTSQPTVGELLDMFEEISSNYEEIIYITISSRISGTYQTGMLAKNQLPSCKISVFDSLNTSVIQKQMVIKSLELIEQGYNSSEIIEELDLIKKNSEIFLVVDDLRHLSRTGRIGNSAALIGSMLKIKPILRFEDGEINLKSKIRTIKRAHQELVDMIENANLSLTSKIMIAYANGYEYAKKLKLEVLKIYPHHEITIDELSPVISVHTGPNTVGIAWIK